MGEIAYKLTADEAQALAAVARLSREFGLNETAIKKAVEATKELEQTQARMGRDAARIFEQTRTPLEQQQIQLKKLDDLYLQNKIDAETYGRAVKQITDESAEGFRKIQDSRKSAFGEEAKNSLQQYASTAALVGNAISAIQERLQGVIELRKQAAQADRSAEMAEGSLAEVAGGDPQKYAALLATSRGIAASAGMKREQAAALTFAAASAGALDEVDTFAQLHQQGIVADPEQLMRATKTIQTAMGAKQSGSLRDITSQLLAAGEHSPQKIAQLGPAAALAGVNADTAGVSTPELLAAVAIQSSATGDAGMAGTMQKSLQKTLSALSSSKGVSTNAKGLAIETDEQGHILDEKAQKLRADARQFLRKASPGLMGQLHAIESMHLDPEQMQKLFGRQEGLMAYNILLKNEAEYKQAVGQIKAAPGENLVGKVLGLPAGDAQGSAAKSARVQEEASKVALAGSQIGVLRNVEDAVYAKLESDIATGKQKPDWWQSPESQIATLEEQRQDPTMRKINLGMRVRGQHRLDDDPALYAQLVQASGGEEKFFPKAVNWRGKESDSPELVHFREITQNLRDASGHLKASAQARPTLAPPNLDR